MVDAITTEVPAIPDQIVTEETSENFQNEVLRAQKSADGESKSEVQQEFETAVLNGDIETVERIIREKPDGFDINAVDSRGRTILFYLRIGGTIFSYSGSRTVGNEEMTEALLKGGLDLSIRDNNGDSAIEYIFDQRPMLVVQHSPQERIRGAYYEFNSFLKTKATEQLRKAVHDRDETKAISLIEAGANPIAEVDADPGESGGITLLEFAAAHKMSDIVKALLDAVPEWQREDFVNHQDNNGNTAFHAAHWSGDKTSQGYLLDAGADWQIKNKSGELAADMEVEQDGEPRLDKRDNPFSSLSPGDWGVHRDRIILEIRSEHTYRMEFFNEDSGKWAEVRTIEGGSGPHLIYFPEAAKGDFKFRFTDMTTGEVYERSDFETAVGDLFDHPGKIAYSLNDVEGEGGDKASSILLGLGVTDDQAGEFRDDRYKDYDAALSLLKDLPDEEGLTKATNEANEKFFEYLAGFADGTNERILFNLYRALGIGQEAGMEGRADIKAIQSDIQKILKENPEIGKKLSEFQDEGIAKLFKDNGGLSAEQIRDRLLADDVIEDILQMPEHLRIEFINQMTGSIAALDPKVGAETNRALLEKILLPKDPDSALIARDEDGLSDATEAWFEFIVNAGRIGAAGLVEVSQPLAQLTTEERAEAAKAIAKYIKEGGRVSELAKESALAELALDGKIANGIGRFFKQIQEKGIAPGLVSALSVIALVQDLTGPRQTDSTAPNWLNTLADVMLIIGPLPGVADALGKSGFTKQTLSRIWQNMSVFNIANWGGGPAASLQGNDVAMEELGDAVNVIAAGNLPADVDRIVDVLKDYKEIVEVLGGEDEVGIRQLAEQIATAMQAPNFDPELFISGLFDQNFSHGKFLARLLSENGALRGNEDAIAELQTALNQIGEAGEDITLEQIEEILVNTDDYPELAGALGFDRIANARTLAEEIHASITAGSFDSGTYIQQSAQRSRYTTGHIENALKDLSVELYTDAERVAEALRANEAIVALVGEDGIDLLARRISEVAKQGQFDLSRFLEEAADLTDEGTAALHEAAGELGEEFTQLYAEWTFSLDEGGETLNFVDYIREHGEEGAAEAFEDYLANNENVPEWMHHQTVIQMVDNDPVNGSEGESAEDFLDPIQMVDMEELLGEDTAEFIAGLSAEERAELMGQLGTIFGEGLVEGAGKIPVKGMTAWKQFVVGAGMMLNVASVIYAVSGFISTAELAKEGKTIPAALTGIVSGSYGLWAVTGSVEVLGPELGASAGLMAVMPWLGFAFGVVSMGGLLGNFIYNNLPSTQFAEKRDFLSEGVGNDKNYLIVAPNDNDDLPDEIRDIDGKDGIRPFAPNEKPNEKMRRPPDDNRSAREIIEDNPVLAQLSDIDKQFLKYGYADTYARDTFGDDFEVTFHGVGDFETDADAAYRAEQVLYRIENYDEGGNKIENSKHIGDGRIDGWTRENRNDPRSEAKHGTEAGRFQDFIKYGYGSLKGDPADLTYDPLQNGSQSNAEWATLIRQDRYSLSTLLDHFFRAGGKFWDYSPDLRELIIEKMDEYLDTEGNRSSFLQSLKDGTLSYLDILQLRTAGLFDEEDDDELAKTVNDWYNENKPQHLQSGAEIEPKDPKEVFRFAMNNLEIPA